MATETTSEATTAKHPSTAFSGVRLPREQQAGFGVLVAYLDTDNADELIALAQHARAARLGTAIATRSLRNDDPHDRAKERARSTR